MRTKYVIRYISEYKSSFSLTHRLWRINLLLWWWMIRRKKCGVNQLLDLSGLHNIPGWLGFSCGRIQSWKHLGTRTFHCFWQQPTRPWASQALPHAQWRCSWVPPPSCCGALSSCASPCRLSSWGWWPRPPSKFFLQVNDPPILGLATLEPIILSFHLKKVVVVQMFLLPASAVFQSRIWARE